MNDERHRVYPASRAGSLDSRLRRLLFPPEKVLDGYIRPGDVVLDVGCGPGFFTLAMARMVGDAGEVIAVDLQEEMIRILREKATQEGLISRIRTHHAEPGSLGLIDPGRIRFALAFYVVHEVPDRARLFQELATLLALGGRLLVVEPKFIVSPQLFQEELNTAQKAGFRSIDTPRIIFSRTVLLQKEDAGVS
jgi:ubiquinone/menaquinone biosynthesis C-methylase UbiE